MLTCYYVKKVRNLVTGKYELRPVVKKLYQ